MATGPPPSGSSASAAGPTGPGPAHAPSRIASVAARVRFAARALMGLGVVLAGLGAWAILDGRLRAGGVAVTGSAIALTVAGVLARRSAVPLDLVLDSLADRTFDAVVLGAIAWSARDADPGTSLGALIALAAGFLGSYVRAKGASLGYGVVESPRTRALRYGLIAVGLLVDDALGWGVWAAAVVSILASLVRSSQVAKEERA